MDSVRWGILGCGDVVRKRVAQAIVAAPGGSLTAACRRDEAALAAFCQSMSIDKGYADAAELLADPDIDAVYIATPVALHVSQTLAAAAAGKHVLVEKPMAMSVAECDQMIAACEKANVRLGVAYYRRFYPLVERLAELLRAGTIGTPLAVSAVTATPLDMSPGEDGYWRVALESGGGGALMDVGSHRINVFTHLFGPINHVKAITRRVAADYPAEDSAVVLLGFQAGIVGTLQCHFGADDPDEFVITGTKGRLIARPLNGDQLIIERDGKTERETLPPPDNFCTPLIADFNRAIQLGRAPRVDGEEGRDANVVMEQAYRSAELI